MTNVIPFKKKEASYYFAGTSHLFDKEHVIESYNKLKVLGISCADIVHSHLQKVIAHPEQFADPASRLKTMAGLFLLFEWEDPGLFQTLKIIFQDEFVLAEEILTADFIAYLPQLLVGNQSPEQLFEVSRSAESSEILRASAVQALVTVSLEGGCDIGEVRDYCWSIWQNKNKEQPLFWMAALEGSLILGDKMRIPALLKALKNKHIEAENRARYLEILEALQKQPLAVYLENMRHEPHLQSKVDVEAFFSQLSLFLELERAIADDEAGTPAPVTVFTLEVRLLGSDFKSELTIADSATFEDLHEGILASIGWEDEHLYAFYMDNNYHSVDEVVMGGEVDAVSEKGGEPAIDTFIWEKNLRKGQSFAYLFDFGDEHRFHIKVKREKDVEDLSEFSHFVYSVDSYSKRPDQYPDLEL